MLHDTQKHSQALIQWQKPVLEHKCMY